MRLSVIIPALNEERGIGQTLERVISIHADEVIVVDGGSQDATCEIAERLASHVIESPRGRALQMNAGAKAAHGDVLLFLHADTMLPPETKGIIQKALSDPRVMGGRFDISLDRAGWLYGLVALLVNLRSRLTKIATGDQAIFVRREVFERIGGFSEIPLMEDVEFSRRLKRLGKIACLRKKAVTSARRWERHGPIKTILLMWCLRFLYFMGVSPDRLRSYYMDADENEKAALAIFAKAPVPGEVKTRLFPYLTPQQAAQLQQAFVLDTLTCLETTGDIKRYLACYPSSTSPFFKQLGQDYQIELLDQQGHDLGERMGGVIKVLMGRGCRRVVLIGTDSPTLPMVYLQMAFEALHRCSVVLGPSRDGGYYLIGLSRCIPELFKGIPWSTEEVFDLTLRKIHSLGYECEILPSWLDVDDIKGLNALKDQLARKPDLAPHTQAFLKSYWTE